MDDPPAGTAPDLARLKQDVVNARKTLLNTTAELTDYDFNIDIKTVATDLDMLLLLQAKVKDVIGIKASIAEDISAVETATTLWQSAIEALEDPQEQKRHMDVLAQFHDDGERGTGVQLEEATQFLKEIDHRLLTYRNEEYTISQRILASRQPKPAPTSTSAQSTETYERPREPAPLPPVQPVTQSESVDNVGYYTGLKLPEFKPNFSRAGYGPLSFDFDDDDFQHALPATSFIPQVQSALGRLSTGDIQGGSTLLGNALQQQQQTNPRSHLANLPRPQGIVPSRASGNVPHYSGFPPPPPSSRMANLGASTYGYGNARSAFQPYNPPTVVKTTVSPRPSGLNDAIAAKAQELQALLAQAASATAANSAGHTDAAHATSAPQSIGCPHPIPERPTNLLAGHSGLPRLSPRAPTAGNPHPTTFAHPFIKLSKLPPLSFNGDRTKWPAFWHQFNATVHAHPMDDSLKFAHLQGMLTGEAKTLIDGYLGTDADYWSALASLEQRYGDPTQLKLRLNAQLNNVKPAENTLTSARHVFDQMDVLLRQLAVAGEDVNTLGMVTLVQKRLRNWLLIELHRFRDPMQPDYVFSIDELRQGVSYILRQREQIASIRGTSEATSKPTRGNHSKKDSRSQDQPRGSGVFAVTKGKPAQRKPPSCRFCPREGHWSTECRTYGTIDDRKSRAQELKLCLNCLYAGHQVNNCKSKGTCFSCGSRHHSSLCTKQNKQAIEAKSTSKPSADTPQQKSHQTHPKKQGKPRRVAALIKEGFTEDEEEDYEEDDGVFASENPWLADTTRTVSMIRRVHIATANEEVLLLTAAVTFRNTPANHKSRGIVFADNGSQVSLISRALAQRLRLLPVGRERLILNTLVEGKPKWYPKYELDLLQRDGRPLRIEAYGSDDFVGPLKSYDPSTRQFNTVTPDLLLGSDLYWNLDINMLHRLDNGLTILDSTLGRMATGPAKLVASIKKASAVVYEEDDLTDAEIRASFQLNNVGIDGDPVANDDEIALAKIRKKTKVLPDGRYQSGWPYNDNDPQLPTNLNPAHKRNWGTWSTVSREPALLDTYDGIIWDWVDSGVAEVVNMEEDYANEYLKHYLPHHPVVRKDKATTKVRIVTDASAKTKAGGKSLNMTLHRGPVILPHIVGMHLNFHWYHIVISADIAKAFLQIELPPEDRDVCRFLWVKDKTKPPTKENVLVLRFKRVPFGVKTSPTLLAVVIQEICKSWDTPVSREVSRHIYVDNVLMFADTTEEAVAKSLEAHKMFASAKMNLREFESNVPLDLPPELLAPSKPISKFLGIVWDKSTDTLRLHVKITESDLATQPTKRIALKKKADVYDPLGVFSPAVLKANLFIQELWKKKSDWDQPLDPDDTERWKELLREWDQGELTIPRVVTSRHPQATYQIHAFGDASGSAVGVSIYTRVWTPEGIHAHLLGAKSRVNPIREISMPKLEATAMVLAFRYAHFIRKELHLHHTDIYLWTDSQCTQKWICSKRLPSPVYVANRIKEIRTDDQCYLAYVRTDENPADIGSRGATLAELRESRLWWHGPSWLSKPEEAWPEKPVKIKDCVPIEEDDDTPEFTVAAAVRAPKHVRVDEDKFDTYERACRRTAWLIRFVRITVLQKTANISDRLLALHADGPTEGPLTATELRVAELATLKLDQQRCPPTESEVRLFGLHPNHDGILICSDRLKNADLPVEGRFPAFLSSNSALLSLLIMHLHRKIMHGGVQRKLAELRQCYFSPRARATVKRTLRSACLVCRKMKAKPFKLPPIAPFPKERVSQSEVFEWIGLDYLGPVTVRARGELRKVWVCLFTCLVTRAVHLEVVPDLSTTGFLHALRRFIARREAPKTILSDNGSQFVLASKILGTMHSVRTLPTDFQSFLREQRIEWTFIPQLTPWYGGAYEVLVGLTKKAFKAAVGRHTIDIDEAQTLFTKIEAILNSRPLTYIYNEPEGTLLRPKHFTNPGRKVTIPVFTFDAEQDDDDELYRPGKLSNQERTSRTWRKSVARLNVFCNVLYREYLPSLRERLQRKIKQGHTVERPPRVGEVVHILEPNSPRAFWPLGIIKSFRAAHPGQLRIANLKTSNNIDLVRPISTLHPLEVGGIEPDGSNDMETAPAEPHAPAEPPAPNNGPPHQRKRKPVYQDPRLEQDADTDDEDVQPTREPVLRRAPPRRARGQRLLMSGMTMINMLIYALIASVVMLMVGAEGPKRPNYRPTNNNLPCKRGCVNCPTWVEACSTYNGPEVSTSDSSLESTKSLLETMKPKLCRTDKEPVTDKNRHCAAVLPFPYHQIQLHDLSLHYVDQLELEHAEDNCVEASDRLNGSSELLQCGAIYVHFSTGEKLPIMAVGTVPGRAYFPYEMSKYLCGPRDCNLECDRSCYRIKFNSHVTMVALCVDGECTRLNGTDLSSHPRTWLHEDSSTARENHIVQATFWRAGEVLQNTELVCRKRLYCKDLNCAWCARAVMNPHCYPRLATVLLYSGLYVVIASVALPIVLAIARCLRQRPPPEAVATISQRETSEGIEMGTYAEIDLQEAEEPFASLDYKRGAQVLKAFKESVFTTALLLFLVGGAHCCADTLFLSAEDRHCLEMPGGLLRCTFDRTTVFSLTPDGQPVCFLLRDHMTRIIGSLTLSVSATRLECQPDHIAYRSENKEAMQLNGKL